MRWVVVFLLAAHAGIVFDFSYRASVTVDENVHLPAGIIYWRTGHFGANNQNPPLSKLAAALPVLALGPNLALNPRFDYGAAGNEYHLAKQFMAQNSDRYFTLFRIGRLTGVGFSSLCGLVIFLWAADLYGAGGGLLALALWCFCPFTITWAGVITSDMSAAALGCTSLFAFRGYLRRPSFGLALTTGVLLGLAELSKFTLLLWYPLGLACWAFWRLRPHSPSSCQARPTGLFSIALTSFLVINLGYGLEGTGSLLGNFPFQSHLFTAGEARWNRFIGTPLADFPVPLPANYLRGIDRQTGDFERAPYPSYLNGELRENGWWYYYLVGLGVKLPLGLLGLLALTLCSAFLPRKGGPPAHESFILWATAAAVMVTVSSQTTFTHHLRYTLPAMPFLLILTGRLAPLAVRAGRLAVFALVALVGWAAVDGLRHHPHHLAYFNELGGGPAGGWRCLIDSNYDWGQDLFRLKQWQDQHPEADPLYLVYYNLVDPSLAGVRYQLPVAADNSGSVLLRPGWYAISANVVCGLPVRLRDNSGAVLVAPPGTFRPFRSLPLADRAGYTIFIYHLGPADVARLRVLMAAQVPRGGS